ncbi:MAG TPA: hypothetical protein VJT69_20640 [Pyrinomonadaceae bacterium]|nr:hypothetical protein [Pyrinomonadaceae bacterium]
MKPHKDSKCDVCATDPFERNNYFYGKQFTVRDLLQEQSYFNDKRHLINRMVLGWGVVCGLDVYWSPEKRKLVVEPGMALDCCGHEIIVCERQYLSFDKNDDDCCLEDRQRPVGKFVLCLEYHECNAEPIDFPAAGCDEKGKTEYNRIRERYKLRLKSWDDSCPKEPRDHICCSDNYKQSAAEEAFERECTTEELHHCLCHRLMEGCPECDNCDCVILATIDFGEPPPDQNYGQGYKQAYGQQTQQGGYKQAYGKQTQQGRYKQAYGQQNYKQDPKYHGKGGGYEQPEDPIVDPCTNRKLVYNNSLLYDLIYCYHGDLPHIVDFSWREHAYPAREVSIDTFLQMMRDGLTVYFDQPMEPDSLNRHTFIVSYLLRDTGTGAFVENRIPVQEIRKDTDGDCYTATFIATERWINKELDADDSELIAGMPNVDSGVDVEITLRGSRIWSTNGKSLDGDYLADKLPTGNGTQGGDFVDWFRVVPAEAKKTKPQSYKDEF